MVEFSSQIFKSIKDQNFQCEEIQVAKEKFAVPRKDPIREMRVCFLDFEMSVELLVEISERRK